MPDNLATQNLRADAFEAISAELHVVVRAGLPRGAVVEVNAPGDFEGGAWLRKGRGQHGLGRNGEERAAPVALEHSPSKVVGSLLRRVARKALEFDRHKSPEAPDYARRRSGRRDRPSLRVQNRFVP